MRRIILNLSFLALCVTGCLSLISCSYDPNNHKIAMILDGGELFDKSYNQGTWEAMSNYLLKKGYSKNQNYTSFTSKSRNDTAYNESIEEAVKWGAKAIICTENVFENAVYDAQQRYPNVKFLIQDGFPHNGDLKPNIQENTMAIVYKEEESGFLAGYAAVKEGCRNLGFIGGFPSKPVQRFGIGYIAGAYQGAKEEKVVIDFDNYQYLNSYADNSGAANIAKQFYDNKVDVILSAAGHAGLDVIKTAEQENKWMIGVDIDQSFISKRVLTSAIKNFDVGIAKFLDNYFSDWGESKILNLGIKEHGVSLPSKKSSWRFKKFSRQNYKLIYDRIKNEEIIVPNNYQNLANQISKIGYHLNISKEVIEGK